MELKINISEGAYKVIEQYAAAEEKSTEDYIQDLFKHYEAVKDKPESIKDNIDHIVKRVKDRKATAVWKKHPWQEYLLKKWSKKLYLVIAWNTCPIQDYSNNYGEDRHHIGEYRYKVEKIKREEIFRHVTETKNYYFPTLQDLKRAINTEFRKYGYGSHYKVKGE